MAHIKKLVMHGFKSFPRKTEIIFTPGINVILGPNGSGKSNISDGLCFVLGRLSSKSMRAEKSRNLIFLGTKSIAPSKEASVEIVFDNSNKTFSIDSNEVLIKRTVRRNGQSIYKINNEVKTRQEILGLLAQAGIDPNGFNIILQGEIQNFVSMHREDRRKIVEEVSGISVYETRKEKSLKELNKTDEKLKEVLAILKERTAYLNNLEKERQQALRFKKLEKDAKRFKASIIYSDLIKKKKETDKINSEIFKKNKEIEKVKKIISTIKAEIGNFESKVNSINLTIKESTGLEQEKLNQEIANLRAELAGMEVKSENYEKKLFEISKKKQELQESIQNNEVSVKKLQRESPTVAGKEKEIKAKKQELEELEEQRKKFYMIKSELRSIRERIKDKNSFVQSYTKESEFLLKQIESISLELFDKKSDSKKLDELNLFLADKEELLDNLNKKGVELEKISYANEVEIDRANKLIGKISKIDVCPVCKSKITENHLDNINKETTLKIENLEKDIESSDKELSEIYDKKEILNQDIEQISSEILKRGSDLVRFSNINNKKEQIKVLYNKIKKARQELSELEKREKILNKIFEENFNIEQRYEMARIEVQEISLRSQKNISSEISFKHRELERSKISLNQLSREEEDLKEDLKEIRDELKSKEKLLEKKKKQEEELSKKFQKLILDRDGFESKIRDEGRELITKQNIIYNIEQGINNFKIAKARVDAELENLEMEMLEFDGVGVIKTNRDSLVQRLAKTKEILSRIGSVNLRSLEVYDSIKKEYDAINERVEIITKEKNSIFKIIHAIDVKKKKVFLKTLDVLNEIFSKNFSQLSRKGRVWLELENRKDPFSGGVGIVVKTGHGKYFDVKSLSGGEQTLVALSLIFAIQEFKPYYFYILDEIDAALDKRNSERLAGLLRKYMQKGQYVIITHNDEVITNATNFYGVSMHDGISKIISLEV